MGNLFSPTTLNQILELRLLIARAGEEDSLAWWTSHALTDEGQWALRRLYPRSAVYAGARLSIDSAVLVHIKAIGHRPAVTLFTLGTDLDNGVMQQLDLRRMDDETLVIPKCIHTQSELRDQLCEVTSLTDQDFTVAESAEIKGDLAELGVLTKAHMLSVKGLQTIIKHLTAAYILSEERHLIVPYYRMKD